MPLQIAVGAYFVLFLPSEVSKMGMYTKTTVFRSVATIISKQISVLPRKFDTLSGIKIM